MSPYPPLSLLLYPPPPHIYGYGCEPRRLFGFSSPPAHLFPAHRFEPDGLTADRFCNPGICAAPPTANADGSYTVPNDWTLKPSAIGAGGRFRLLFITSTTRNASSSNIADYNTFVQGVAAGHMAIRPYSSAFRVLASTASVHARDNAMTTGAGVPIYWLGSTKTADDYPDFHDGTWDGLNGYDESGNSRGGQNPFTSSNDDGTAFTGEELGQKNTVRLGSVNTGLGGLFSITSNQTAAFFALSPIFMAGVPVVTITLGSSPVTESSVTSFTVTTTPAPAGTLSVADASDSDFLASTPKAPKRRP